MKNRKEQRSFLSLLLLVLTILIVFIMLAEKGVFSSKEKDENYKSPPSEQIERQPQRK